MGKNRELSTGIFIENNKKVPKKSHVVFQALIM